MLKHETVTMYLRVSLAEPVDHGAQRHVGEDADSSSSLVVAQIST